MSRKNGQDFFATTRWTMVLRTGDSDAASAARALEDLCRIYWFPLYAYVRGRGYSREDAEDLTQGFFEQLLKRRDFSGLQAERGRFRAYLLASLKHYMANEYDRKHRMKRGGGQIPLSLDWTRATARFEVMDASSLSPEEIFDREWALALLQRVMDRLREEWVSKGNAALFDSLKDFLTVGSSDSRYGQIAGDLGLSEGNLRVAAHRLRKRYRELLKEEIAQTLDEPGMVDEELQALMKVFSR